jgi:site-specific DNA-adenine methylase
MSAQTLYNRIKQTDYRADGYLEGVETVKLDYRKLFARYGRSKCVFIIDPPYLSTDVKTYSADYWKLKDYLDVLNAIDGVNYVYFTSEKSNVVELCEWIEKRGMRNPFRRAIRCKISVTVPNAGSYEEIVLYTPRKQATPLHSCVQTKLFQ